MGGKRKQTQPDSGTNSAFNRRVIPGGSRGGPDAIARAMELLSEGYAIQSVADALGVTRQTIYEWRDSPTGQDALKAARAERSQAFRDTVNEARSELKSLALRAVRVLGEDLVSEDPEVRQRAAKTVLDRVGLPRTERHELVPQREDLSRLSDDEVEALRALRAKLEG